MKRFIHGVGLEYMDNGRIIEEQHPIPQQISAFQFHLVGDMTLKQFLYVAGGALIGLLIYATGLPGLVKWPLILISVGGGAAIAFVPLQDRPLTTWILSFFQSIYSPTIFVWQKGSYSEEVYQPEDAQSQTAAPQGVPATTPAPEAKPLAPAETNLEEKEKSFLSRIMHLTISGQAPAAPTSDQAVSAVTQALFVPPVFATTIPKKVISDTPIKPTEIKKEVFIPQIQAISVEKTPTSAVFEAPASGEEFSQRQNSGTVAPVLKGSGVVQSASATFSKEASPPTPPTRPNIVVGQVLDPEGKIVEAAILEIKDSEGRPVRALKTNRLGHFMIATPLSDGKYQIFTEKEGFEFEPIAFDTKGEVVEPIAIWAKSKSKNPTVN